MLASLELEIKYLLAHESSLEKVVEQIIATIEKEGDEMTTEHVETLCRFLINSRSFAALIAFVQKHWNQEYFRIPWPYFITALEKQLDQETAALLIEGITEESREAEAARSPLLDPYRPEFAELRSNYRTRVLEKLDQEKFENLAQLRTLRLQQLFEQEKHLLQRLLKMYPGDADVIRESSDFKERNALEVISRHAPLRKSIIWDDPIDPEMEKIKVSWSQTLLEASASSPSQAFELAVAAFTMELYDASYRILELAQSSPEKKWFRLEVLLQTRRYLELLQDLALIEVELSHDPETFFSTAYLRAQALWGLGQKHLALEVMEGVVNVRPNYRMGQTLLSQWRGS